MWELEVEKWFGFKPGVIGGGSYNIDSPIVVSNIQTVRKHGAALSSEFGILVIDEAHHCVAATFELLVMFSKAKIKVGLTGTLKRKDGLHACFSNYFGLEVFKPAESNTLPPEIHLYNVPCEVPGNQQTPWAIRINELYKQPEYTTTIKDLANSYALLGHKVLVVSDRIELLETFHESNLVKSFIITGNTHIDDRFSIMDEIAEYESGCILWATQSIFAEGVSLDELSCIILGVPTNNESLVQQLVGRIQRIATGKLSPIVVDLGLQCNTGIRHRSVRKSVYYQRGWAMIPYSKDRLAKQLKEKLSC